MGRPRRYGRRVFNPSAVAGLIILALVAYRTFVAPPSAPEPVPAGEYRVERVVDGDTLMLSGRVRVRLIGVDTPETIHSHRPAQPLADEATEFTRRHVEHRPVRLEYDREREDRFGRTLAYVYLGDWFLNEEIIRNWFSRAKLHYPNSAAMKRRFRAAEEQARAERLGIWALESEQAPSPQP